MCTRKCLSSLLFKHPQYYRVVTERMQPRTMCVILYILLAAALRKGLRFNLATADVDNIISVSELNMYTSHCVLCRKMSAQRLTHFHIIHIPPTFGSSSVSRVSKATSSHFHSPVCFQSTAFTSNVVH